MISYSWVSKDNKIETKRANTLEEFKTFIHENKSDIKSITAEIDGRYWKFDLRGGWKETDNDPDDTPF